MAEPVNLQPTTVHHDPIRVALDCLEEGFQIIGRELEIRLRESGRRTARPARRGAVDRQADH